MCAVSESFSESLLSGSLAGRLLHQCVICWLGQCDCNKTQTILIHGVNAHMLYHILLRVLIWNNELNGCACLLHSKSVIVMLSYGTAHLFVSIRLCTCLSAATRPVLKNEDTSLA